MARNKEKQFSKLNRFLLAQQLEEEEAKGERLVSKNRPHLHTLKTVEEVKKWIPSIKRELDYNLQQLSGVRNYPEVKIKEFREKVNSLEIEHKRFIRKVFQLDPQAIDEPWKPRAYRRQKRNFGQIGDDQPQRKKFHLPLLDKEKQSQAAAVTSQNAVADDHQDKPLELKAVPNPYLSAAAARFAKNQANDNYNWSLADEDSKVEDNGVKTTCLGLDYSSSDSDIEKIT